MLACCFAARNRAAYSPLSSPEAPAVRCDDIVRQYEAARSPIQIRPAKRIMLQNQQQQQAVAWAPAPGSHGLYGDDDGDAATAGALRGSWTFGSGTALVTLPAQQQQPMKGAVWWAGVVCLLCCTMCLGLPWRPHTAGHGGLKCIFTTQLWQTLLQHCYLYATRLKAPVMVHFGVAAWHLTPSGLCVYRTSVLVAAVGDPLSILNVARVQASNKPTALHHNLLFRYEC